MVLKRYASKYKKLARFKQPLWLEKRGKIKKFKREKWGGAKRFYFPKRRKEELKDNTQLMARIHRFSLFTSFSPFTIRDFNGNQKIQKPLPKSQKSVNLI